MGQFSKKGDLFDRLLRRAENVEDRKQEGKWRSASRLPKELNSKNEGVSPTTDMFYKPYVDRRRNIKLKRKLEQEDLVALERACLLKGLVLTKEFCLLEHSRKLSSSTLLKKFYGVQRHLLLENKRKAVLEKEKEKCSGKGEKVRGPVLEGEDGDLHRDEDEQLVQESPDPMKQKIVIEKRRLERSGNKPTAKRTRPRKLVTMGSTPTRTGREEDLIREHEKAAQPKRRRLTHMDNDEEIIPHDMALDVEFRDGVRANPGYKPEGYVDQYGDVDALTEIHGHYTGLSKRPYQCLKCPDNFRTLFGLRCHVREIHDLGEGEVRIIDPSYRCTKPGCMQSCSSLTILNAHIAYRHPDLAFVRKEQLLQCPICCSFFAVQSALRRHMSERYNWNLDDETPYEQIPSKRKVAERSIELRENRRQKQSTVRRRRTQALLYERPRIQHNLFPQGKRALTKREGQSSALSFTAKGHHGLKRAVGKYSNGSEQVSVRRRTGGPSAMRFCQEYQDKYDESSGDPEIKHSSELEPLSFVDDAGGCDESEVDEFANQISNTTQVEDETLENSTIENVFIEDTVIEESSSPLGNRMGDEAADFAQTGKASKPFWSHRRESRRGRTDRFEELSALSFPPIKYLTSSDSASNAEDQDSERVCVWNRRTGSIMKGSDAPLKKELKRFLREHPGFEVFENHGVAFGSFSTAPPSGNNKIEETRSISQKEVRLAFQEFHASKPVSSCKSLRKAVSELGTPLLLNDRLNSVGDRIAPARTNSGDLPGGLKGQRMLIPLRYKGAAKDVGLKNALPSSNSEKLCTCIRSEGLLVLACEMCTAKEKSKSKNRTSN